MINQRDKKKDNALKDFDRKQRLEEIKKEVKGKDKKKIEWHYYYNQICLSLFFLLQQKKIFPNNVGLFSSLTIGISPLFFGLYNIFLYISV